MTENKRFDVYTELLHTGIGITDKGKELTGNDVVTLLNQLTNENEELKASEEYWKGECLSNGSLNQILRNELDIAQEKGYEPTNPFKQYISD